MAIKKVDKKSIRYHYFALLIIFVNEYLFILIHTNHINLSQTQNNIDELLNITLR